MELGQRVKVVAFGGQELTRRVVVDRGRSVVVCNEQEYTSAMSQGRAPEGVGFPFKDVHLLTEAGAEGGQ
jgi:hypothetical protein